jgi:hypothetical protein
MGGASRKGGEPARGGGESVGRRAGRGGDGKPEGRRASSGGGASIACRAALRARDLSPPSLPTAPRRTQAALGVSRSRPPLNSRTCRRPPELKAGQPTHAA